MERKYHNIIPKIKLQNYKNGRQFFSEAIPPKVTFRDASDLFINLLNYDSYFRTPTILW